MTGEDRPPERSSSDDDSLRPRDVLTLGGRKLLTNRAAAGVVVLAGFAVAVLDYLRLRDPVPVVEYASVGTLDFEVFVGPLVSISTRAGLDPFAVQGLRLHWLAWTVGVEVLKLTAIVGAVTYAVGEMLDRRVTAGATARYGVVLAALVYGSNAFDLQFAPGFALWALLVAVTGVTFAATFATPGLLVAGRSIDDAVTESVRLFRTSKMEVLFAVVLFGTADHFLSSVPLAGPVGSGAVAALHAGTVAALIDREYPRESSRGATERADGDPTEESDGKVRAGPG